MGQSHNHNSLCLKPYKKVLLCLIEKWNSGTANVSFNSKRNNQEASSVHENQAWACCQSQLPI